MMTPDEILRQADERIAARKKQEQKQPEASAQAATPRYLTEEEMGFKPQRTWGEAATDTAAGLAGGVAGLVKTGGGLYGLASGSMDNYASRLGQQGQEFFEGKKSDYLRGKIEERQRKMDAQDSEWGKAWTAASETLTDPALALDTVAQNIATMLPGAAAGRVAKGAMTARGFQAAQAAGPVSREAAAQIAKRAGTAGVGTAVGIGAVQQGADVAGDIYGELLKKTDAQWQASPEYAAMLQKHNGNADAAKQDLALQTARAAFLPAAGISVAANAIPGATLLERAIVGAPAKAAGKGGVLAGVKALAQGVLGEGFQETIEEGGGKLGANIAAQQVAMPEHGAFEGVGEAAGMGFAGGALLGGVGGARAGVQAYQGGGQQPQATPEQVPVAEGEGSAEQTPIEQPPPPYIDEARMEAQGLRQYPAPILDEQRIAQRLADGPHGEDLGAFEWNPSTAPGATEQAGDGIDFTRDFDTSGLELEPPISQQMGLRTAQDGGGALESAAALAVDGGASPAAAEFIASTGRELTPLGQAAQLDGDVIDVEAREVWPAPELGMTRRIAQDAGAGQQASPRQQAALPAPTNLREGLERIRQQRAEAARMAGQAAEQQPSIKGVQDDGLETNQAQQAKAQQPETGIAPQATGTSQSPTARVSEQGGGRGLQAAGVGATPKGDVAQIMRGLAQQFAQRHADTGRDTDRTFAAVLNQFADDVRQGKRTPQSVQPMLERYQEMLGQAAPVQQAAPAAGPQGQAPGESREQRAKRLDEAGAQWTRMPAAERSALVGRLDGVKPVLAKNMPKAEWGKLNADVQGKLADAMGTTPAQDSGANEPENQFQPEPEWWTGRSEDERRLLISVTNRLSGNAFANATTEWDSLSSEQKTFLAKEYDKYASGGASVEPKAIAKLIARNDGKPSAPKPKQTSPRTQKAQAATEQQAAPGRQSAESAYTLPSGSIGDEWRDEQKRSQEHPDFTPTPRQQRLMSEVKKVLDSGAFSSNDVTDKVAKALGVSDEVLASNRTGVQGGDFGYDVYHARKAVEAQAQEADAAKIRAELNLRAGDKLGTLIFNDFKQTNSVEVVSITEDGRRASLKGKRGAATVTFETTVPTVKLAIERAHDRGKRKDSYEEFIAGRSASLQEGDADARRLEVGKSLTNAQPQDAPATHADPGQAPEAATPAVVAESLQKAASNEDTKPSEMRKWLLAEIDKELLQAPDRADYDEAVKRMGEKDANSMFTGNGPLGKNSETGFVTFDVPGDGKYKVRNSVRGLLEFRKNVMASSGFKDNGQKQVKPEQNQGVRGGSGGRMAAITNMIEEGDFEAARDYAEAVGIKLEDVKVPRGDMKPAWEKYLKDGALPPAPDTRPQPAPKTAAQLDEEKQQDDDVRQEADTDASEASWRELIAEREAKIGAREASFDAEIANLKNQHFRGTGVFKGLRSKKAKDEAFNDAVRQFRLSKEDDTKAILDEYRAKIDAHPYESVRKAESARKTREMKAQMAADAARKAAQPITRADVEAAQQQAAAIIGARIDAMTAGEVNTIAKKFLPTMGMKPTMSKANNKAAMTDPKINLEAAAAEVGATLPAEVTRALQADMEGRVVDVAQDGGTAKPTAQAQQEEDKARQDDENRQEARKAEKEEAAARKARAENPFADYNALAQQQLRETERAYGGRDAYQKAKDVGKTKLTFGQWVQVRTPNFKRWFGDWENDPANASKVVDSKTGEPLVVYHGTNADFSKFDKEYQRTGQYGGEGFFFTANPETSGLFGDAIMPVFLRAKTGILEKRRARTEGREVSVDHIRPQNDQRDIWVVFDPEQIKSATGNIGTFDPQNADIRRFEGPAQRRPGTAQDKAVMQAIANGKSARDVLRVVADGSKDPFLRQVARLLLKAGITPNIQFGHIGKTKKGDPIHGQYRGKSDTIAMAGSAEYAAERIFMHEAMHAATMRALAKPGLVRLQMQKLLEHVRKNGSAAGFYGIKNVDEFVAEVFTNPDFQAALRKMNAPSGSSGIKTAWDGFVRILRSILGLKNDPNNVLSQALQLGVAAVREDMGLRKRGARRAGMGAQRAVGDAPPAEATRVQQAIEGKSLLDAARFLTQSSNPAYAEIANKVLEKLQAMQRAGVNLSLHVVHVGDSAPQAMAYSRAYTEMALDAKGRDVAVWINGADVTGKVGTEEEALLHELVHAATAGALLHGSKVAASPHARAAKAIYEAAGAISEHISRRFEQAEQGKATLTAFEQDMRDGRNNAFRDMDEVVAWALTNREAQQYLDGIPYHGGQTLWTHFVQAVRSFLGLEAKADSVLSEVLAAAEQLMDATDTTLPAVKAFWHKRGLPMVTQQAAGSYVTRQPAADQTDTAAFKRWFGDSKVVDAEGKPLVVYHGTNIAIESFNSGGGARASYFSTSENLAEQYADERSKKKGGAGKVYQVYLKISNPMVVDANGSMWDSIPVGGIENNDKELRSLEKKGVSAITTNIAAQIAYKSGFDGVVIKNVFDGYGYSTGSPKSSVYAVFSPEQIKSATDNNGNFDPEDPSILNFGVDSQPSTQQGPAASKFDDFVYKLQDKHIDLKRVVQAVKDAKNGIADAMDTYLQETLFHGRAAKRTQDFVSDEIGNLTRTMQELGVSMKETEDYLHARHAPEANRVLAERNPTQAMIDAGLAQAEHDVAVLETLLEQSPTDKALKRQLKDAQAQWEKWSKAQPYKGTEEQRNALSGMSNAEAKAIMDGLSADKKQKLAQAAELVDAIIAKTRQQFVDYDLEAQDTVDAWSAEWQHYIPLMREQLEDDNAGMRGMGQGMSVKGRETKGRTGSTRQVVDILANIAMQRERAIVRGEKNRVAQSLLELAKANPIEGFWKVDAVPMVREIDPATGLVRSRPDPTYRSKANVVIAKVDGKEHAVIFDEDNPRAMRMAEALKNLDAAQLEGLIGGVAQATRYFAAINTQYNPIFGATNLVRDVQHAMLAMSTTPIAGKQAQILGDIPRALGAVLKDERARRKGQKGQSQWAQLWEEFQDAGGQTGYRDQFKNSADRGKEIERALNPDAWAESKLGRFITVDGRLKAPLSVVRKHMGWMLDLLDDYNTAMENSTRLAAYKAGRDAGLSKERAAELAKNLTVNFNRKGQATQQIGALYAFFNASVQGTARIGETLFTMEPGKPKTMRLSKAGKAIVTGGVMLGAIQAVLLAAAGFDEDEPPEFIRERNILIPTGGKSYVSIPMPLGFHVLANLGRIPMEWAMGGFEDTAKHLGSLLDVGADVYNPLGGSGLSLQTITPTVVDPFAALAENKDFTGKPIAKQSFDKQTPGHALARDTASLPATWLAQAVNYLSGGSEYTRGQLSPTPDQFDYLVGQVTGGVGREATKMLKSGQMAAGDEEWQWHNVPLLGRFYGDVGGSAGARSAYYNALDGVRKHAAEVKGLRNGGRAEEAMSYMQKHPEASMHMAANAAEAHIKALRDRARDLKEQGAERAQIREVEDAMTAAMQRFVELVKARV